MSFPMMNVTTGTDTETGSQDNSSSTSNLPCPFDEACPGSEKGYPDMSKVNEHLKRCHTREHRCMKCKHRFNALPEGKLKRAKNNHRCGDVRPRGRQYPLMTEEQDRAYRNVTKKTWEAVTSALKGRSPFESAQTSHNDDETNQDELRLGLRPDSTLVLLTGPESESTTEIANSTDLSDSPGVPYHYNLRDALPTPLPPLFYSQMPPSGMGSGIPPDYFSVTTPVVDPAHPRDPSGLQSWELAYMPGPKPNMSFPEEGDVEVSLGLDNRGTSVSSEEVRHENNDQPWSTWTMHSRSSPHQD